MLHILREVDLYSCKNIQIMLNESQWPQTISSAVDWIISTLDENQKQLIQETKADDLIMLHFGLGMFIRNELGLYRGNDALMRDCTKSEGIDEKSYFAYDADTASGVLSEAVWKRLNKLD